MALVLMSLLLPGVPVVNVVPSRSKTEEGGNLTFVCHVTGSPTPSVGWRTEELHSDVSVQVCLSLSVPLSLCPCVTVGLLPLFQKVIWSSMLEVVLHLTNVSSRDNLHNLTCEAENEAGPGEDVVQLDIECEWSRQRSSRTS